MKNVKKALSLVLVAVMLLCSLPMAVSAVDTGYTYTVTDGKATITGADSTITGDITIPSTLGGYPVVEIGNYAFEGNTALTGVVIPESVKSIGLYAFKDCTNLATITIEGNSLESVREKTFENTAWLNTKPDGDVYLGNCYYKYKGTMPENTTITVKTGTKVIAGQAFKDQSNLVAVSFPDSLVTIGESAFSRTGLTSVDIPSSVTTIEDTAFISCRNLSTVTLHEGLKTIGSGAFRATGLTSIVIPASVTTLAMAFTQCTALETVTFLGDNIETIFADTFEGTAWFDAQPDGDVYIADHYYCYKGTMPENTTLTIKDGTKSIVNTAIANNTSARKNLVGIVIPSSVKTIGKSAVCDCENLSSVVIKDGVEEIQHYAFFECGALTRVFIPSSVTNIYDRAFGYIDTYEKLEGFTIEGFAGTAAEKYAIDNGFTFVEHAHTDTNGDELCDTCGAPFVAPTEPSALNDKTAKILAAVFEFIVFLVDAIIKLAQSKQAA